MMLMFGVTLDGIRAGIFGSKLKCGYLYDKLIIYP